MKASTIVLCIIGLILLLSLALVWYYTGNSTLFLGMLAVMGVGMWLWYDPQFDTRERLEADYQLKRWKEMVQEMGISNNANIPTINYSNLEARLHELETKLSRLENSNISTPSYDYGFNKHTTISMSDVKNFSLLLSKTLDKWDTLDGMKKSLLIFQLEKTANNPLLFEETINTFKNIDLD